MIFEQYKRDFMKRNIQAAEEAGAPMLVHVAAGAALVSGFGTTKAYILWNNPFNVTYYAHPKHGLHLVPAEAFEGKTGWRVVCETVSFDTLARCYSAIRESIEELGEDWPEDNEDDVQLDADVDNLAYEYLRGLERGFDQ